MHNKTRNTPRVYNLPASCLSTWSCLCHPPTEPLTARAPQTAPGGAFTTSVRHNSSQDGVRVLCCPCSQQTETATMHARLQQPASLLNRPRHHTLLAPLVTSHVQVQYSASHTPRPHSSLCRAVPAQLGVIGAPVCACQRRLTLSLVFKVLTQSVLCCLPDAGLASHTSCHWG